MNEKIGAAIVIGVVSHTAAKGEANTARIVMLEHDANNTKKAVKEVQAGFIVTARATLNLNERVSKLENENARVLAEPNPPSHISFPKLVTNNIPGIIGIGLATRNYLDIQSFKTNVKKSIEKTFIGQQQAISGYVQTANEQIQIIENLSKQNLSPAQQRQIISDCIIKFKQTLARLETLSASSVELGSVLSQTSQSTNGSSFGCI